MTTEKRIELITKMLFDYDIKTGSNAAKSVLENPHRWVDNHLFETYAAAAEMLIDARADLDKRTSKAGTLAALKRIAASKNHPSMAGIYERQDEAGNNIFILCDGHRLIRLQKDVESIGRNTDSRITSESFNRMMQGTDSGEELDLPTVAELKAFLSQERARLGKEYKNSNHAYRIELGLWVNAQYLIDMIEALPGCKAYRPTRKYAPIYFKAESGDGVLLPINIKEEEKAA